jgi:hypothetical protein
MLVRYYRFFGREDYPAAHSADADLQSLLRFTTGRLTGVPVQSPGFERSLRTAVFGEGSYCGRVTIHTLQFQRATRLVSWVLDVNLLLLGPLQACLEYHRFNSGLIGEVPPDLTSAISQSAGFQDLVVLGVVESFTRSISATWSSPQSGTATGQCG